jgi:hypothetical protein
MSEISRTKKELAFANKQLYNTKTSGFGNDKAQDNFNSEIERSIKVVETIGIQKKVLEDENEELKSRISEMLAERDQMNANTRKRFEQDTVQTFSSNTTGVPPLNLGRSGGAYN